MIKFLYQDAKTTEISFAQLFSIFSVFIFFALLTLSIFSASCVIGILCFAFNKSADSMIAFLKKTAVYFITPAGMFFFQIILLNFMDFKIYPLYVQALLVFFCIVLAIALPMLLKLLFGGEIKRSD